MTAGLSIMFNGRRYHTDPSGTFWQCNAKAIGSGSEGADSSLQEQYSKVSASCILFLVSSFAIEWGNKCVSCSDLPGFRFEARPQGTLSILLILFCWE